MVTLRSRVEQFNVLHHKRTPITDSRYTFDHEPINALPSVGNSRCVTLSGPNRQPLTYLALREHVQQTLAVLSVLGIGRNGRIPIVLPNGPELVDCLERRFARRPAERARLSKCLFHRRDGFFLVTGEAPRFQCKESNAK